MNTSPSRLLLLSPDVLILVLLFGVAGFRFSTTLHCLQQLHLQQPTEPCLPAQDQVPLTGEYGPHGLGHMMDSRSRPITTCPGQAWHRLLLPSLIPAPGTAPITLGCWTVSRGDLCECVCMCVCAWVCQCMARAWVRAGRKTFPLHLALKLTGEKLKLQSVTGWIQPLSFQAARENLWVLSGICI